MGAGFAVLSGAEAAAAGAPAEAVAALVRRRAVASITYFYVDDLEYLRRGGRIGTAAAVLGSALSVKPLLTVADGVIQAYERVRTASKALARLEELGLAALARAAGQSARVDVAVHHLDNLDGARPAGRAPERTGRGQRLVSRRSARCSGCTSDRGRWASWCHRRSDCRPGGRGYPQVQTAAERHPQMCWAANRSGVPSLGSGMAHRSRPDPELVQVVNDRLAHLLADGCPAGPANRAAAGDAPARPGPSPAEPTQRAPLPDPVEPVVDLPPLRRFSRRHLGVVGVLLVLALICAGWALFRARPVAVASPAYPVSVSPPQPGPSAATPRARDPAAAEIVVHVLGAVRRPGLVRLPQALGSRTRSRRPAG